MFSYYKETNLEQWISSMLLENRIFTPADLHDLEAIAETFDVKLLFSDSPSFSDNELRVIFIDKRASDARARTVFFHELCHVLRHAGDQRYMPELFEQAQEFEAEAFVLYATMPFYMFSQLELPDRKWDAMYLIADTFNVSLDLAEQRLEQIYRREMNGSLAAELRSQELTNHRKNRQPTWSPETQRILKQLNRQLLAKGMPGYRDKGLL
ncbi:hypothetical protein D3C77_456780 [compost metagenome]